MAPKRKYEESEAPEFVHPSRQFQVPGSIPKPAKKSRRFEQPAEYKKQMHASSVNAIKKRMRDVTRKLERTEYSSAEKKLEDERALAAYQQEYAEAEAEKIRQKMIKKYHMVRFFERQKATRLLKKLRKRLLSTESTEEVETLKAQMHIVEVDLNYTQYHPLSERYISLYPPADSEEEDTNKTDKQRPKPALWAEVERAMEEGTLDRLRNRRSNAPVKIAKSVESKPLKSKLRSRSEPVPPQIDTTGLNRRQRRKALGIQDSRAKAKAKEPHDSAQGHGTDAGDGGSDGGFFEL